MAWIANYTCRKPLPANGTADGQQTLYQMKYTIYKGSGVDAAGTVYLGSNVKDDFSDIYFTDSDGTTELKYWIESAVSGTSAVVWIEHASIPASPSTNTIYIYYNYAGATSGSDGDNAFSFHDDFPGSSLDGSKWTTAGTVSVSGGEVIITTSTGMINGKTNFGAGYAAYGKAKVGGTGARIFAFRSSDDLNACTFYWDSGTYFKFTTAKAGTSRAVTTAFTGDTAYHIFEIKHIASNNVIYLIDGSSVGTETSTTYIPIVDIPLDISRFAAGESRADYVFVRKITLNEPTWGTPGAEEHYFTPKIFIF